MRYTILRVPQKVAEARTAAIKTLTAT